MPSATQTRIRRDTKTNLDGVTPASSEVAHDSTNNRLHVGDGSRAAGWQLPNFRDIQTQAFGYATAGGTADVLTLTLAPALLAYTAGVSLEFKAAATNTTGVTINVNTLGAKNIYKMSNGALGPLEAGDIVSGGIYRITYDGTQFQIKALSETPSTAGWNLLATVSGGGTSYDFDEISSDYENYAFVFNHVLMATNSQPFQLRVRRSGQGSYDTGSTDYGNNTLTQKQASNTGVTATSDCVSDDSLILIPSVTSTNAQGICGTVYAFGLGESVYAMFEWSLANVRIPSSRFWTESCIGRGGRATSTAIDAVRFMAGSGNITSGQIDMYGLTTP